MLSVLTALCAIVIGPYIPESLAFQPGAEAVETVLNIVATSMLTVATFSLGIMANAIRSAADGATPRAAALMPEDRVSQTALATFLGAFAFALVGIIALQVGIYDNGGRIILLGMTVLVIVLIYVAFIRWVNRLRTFGRIPDTLDHVEKAATEAIEQRVLHSVLHDLVQISPAIRGHSAQNAGHHALARAEVALTLDADREELRALHARMVPASLDARAAMM